MNAKIFIGRENELEQFRRTMDTLIQSPKSGEYYANTILMPIPFLFMALAEWEKQSCVENFLKLGRQNIP
jgi:hypothetical protein